MYLVVVYWSVFFFFKQKTAYEITEGDWSSDVCSSDLWSASRGPARGAPPFPRCGHWRRGPVPRSATRRAAASPAPLPHRPPPPPPPPPGPPPPPPPRSPNPTSRTTRSLTPPERAPRPARLPGRAPVRPRLPLRSSR